MVTAVIQATSLAELRQEDSSWAGSKAVRLGQLMRAGFTVPAGLVIGADAYRRYVTSTGLLEEIQLILHRKKFEDMRWEELWDLALRVRNRFLRTPLPSDLQEDLENAIVTQSTAGPVAVRSAGLSEDSKTASFAGLHDSFINVLGIDEIISKIVLVWASLWSDRALLYRKELGLHPLQSRIAVIVQEFIVGTASGVAFSRDPNSDEDLLIEGVWGLNQGMVDGTVPAHRWKLNRRSGEVTQFIAASQSRALRAEPDSTHLVDLPSEEQAGAPLGDRQVDGLFRLVTEVEDFYRAPQDVEWTLVGNEFIVLQARPITAGIGSDAEDRRRWYLTLHRSVDNLMRLRENIRKDVLPGMDREADRFASVDPGGLSSEELIPEIKRRREARDRWVKEYWEYCIPFAHGMRLFGQIYNDQCRPDDPFEFIELLRNDGLLGAQRNEEMRQLSRDLAELRAGKLNQESFDIRLDSFLDRFGLNGLSGTPQERDGLLNLLGRLPSDFRKPEADRNLRLNFLNRFSGERRDTMATLLELARDSYSLRDDDNIYLGRIEAQLVAAVQEASRRIVEVSDAPKRSAAELIRRLEDPGLSALVDGGSAVGTKTESYELRARQLVGQPATPGIAVGQARVITDAGSLLSFRQGEILVCDSIDPNMTFVAPLAAGVVERRGGMLIHGAIIAREYGIPCVTGVPDAADWIRTGDTVSVDGFLGLVTITEPAVRNPAPLRTGSVPP